jgi:hypothetical protein
MMRTLTLSTLTLLLCGTSSAQTITQANAVPPFGNLGANRYIAEDVPWSLLDTVGSGLTWNLTGLSLQPSGSVELILSDVASSPYALSVPEASILLEEIEGEFTYLSFFNNSPGQLDLVANGFSDPDNTDIFEACPTLQMTYPGVLNTIVAPTITGCGLELVDYERRITATGSILTTFGNINNVVLIRTRRCILEEIDGQWFTSCYNSYDWYQEGNILTPILTADLDGSTTIVVLNFPTGSTGVGETREAQLQLQPNPATDQIVLQQRNDLPLGEVRIHAADGRVVRELGPVALDRLNVDVHDLKPGVYTVSCNTGALPVVLRFVKE